MLVPQTLLAYRQLACKTMLVQTRFAQEQRAWSTSQTSIIGLCWIFQQGGSSPIQSPSFHPLQLLPCIPIKICKYCICGLFTPIADPSCSGISNLWCKPIKQYTDRHCYGHILSLRSNLLYQTELCCIVLKNDLFFCFCVYTMKASFVQCSSTYTRPLSLSLCADCKTNSLVP